jgi:hypothetical protein
MKIDADLRAAIKAAEKAQPSDFLSERAKVADAAIQAFLKKRPALRKKLALLLQSRESLLLSLQKRTNDLNELVYPFGLRIKDNKVCESFLCDDDDAEKFTEAGGVIPEMPKRWKADELIAKLAAADPKHRDSILKEHGINWN